MDKDLKIRLEKWRKQIGYKEAKRRLKAQQISESMAQKLLAETYPNDPKPLYKDAIEAAMSKAG